MKKYLFLTTLITFSVQAKETFFNHTKYALPVRTNYSFCMSEDSEVPRQIIKDMKTGATNISDKAAQAIIKAGCMIAIIPGETTNKMGKECCLSQIKVYSYMAGGGGYAVLYEHKFAGCKDRTFHIYGDPDKLHDIRVEWSKKDN